MTLPKLNPTLSKLRNEIRKARSVGLLDTEIVEAIVWAISAIDGNWAIADSEALSGKLAWILGELPYDTSEIETPPTKDFGPYLTKRDRSGS